MDFQDFIGSVENQGTLDKIHGALRRFLCINYNYQCMKDDDEYHRALKEMKEILYVLEGKPAVYEVKCASKVVMVVDFAKGEIVTPK